MEYVTVLCFITLILILLDYKWKPKQSNALPYRIPVIGHVMLFLKDDVHKVLTYWSTRAGNVFTVQIFNKQIIVLNGYEAIYEGLVKAGKDIGGRMKTFRLEYTLEGKDIFSQDVSPIWLKRRKLLHGYLKQYGDGLENIEKIVLNQSQEFTDSIMTKSDSLHRFDPTDEVYMVILSIITTLITGENYNNDDPTFKQWLHMAIISEKGLASVNNGWELDLFPWLRHFGNNTYKMLNKFKDTSKEIYKCIKSSWLDKRDGCSKLEGIAFALLETMHQGNCDYIDDDIIRLLIADLVSAGIVTSSVALNAFIQIMACYPAAQQKLYLEITSTLHKLQSERIQLENRENMPYTRACLLELQRYVSISALSVPRVALTDTTIQGHFIKKDSVIVPNLWQLHHDSDIWDNPWDFQPERFIDENGELVSSDHKYRTRLMPFSAGVRACPGQQLANSRLFIIITTLVKRFNIKTVGEDTCDQGMKLCDPRLYAFEGLLTPKRHKLRFIPRN